MTNRKIDRSLSERHSILNLLERLNRDSITVGEMEDIGMKLQKAGKRALPPLVRKLWREKNGDLISRYAYLLDFFDDEAWLDQLVRITLTRKDLGTEGKSALLAALENYGIDVSAPPFSRILHEVGGPLSLTLPRVLEKGEEGYIIFMEDFCGYPQEVQCSIVREFPEVEDPRIFTLYGILLEFDNPVVVADTLASLGRTRKGPSVSLLRRFLGKERPDELRLQAERSLKRLGFLGFDTDIQVPEPYRNAFHATLVTPFDGAGNRSIWICRERCADALFDLLVIQIHEGNGILDAISYGGLGSEEYEALFKESGEDENYCAVKEEYALLLIRDALFLSRENELDLPPEYFVRGTLFSDRDMTPLRRIPDFGGFDLERISASSRYLSESAQLLDEPFFSDWFLATPTVYDRAEEWRTILAGGGREKEQTAVARGIIERFCREVIVPDLDRITRRLFLTADLMMQTGEVGEKIERALAVALGISSSRLPPQVNPFLRRLALESLEAAREALAEGYDIRNDPYFDEFDE